MHIGAYGWDHDGWQGPFYPDDLPAEWRLTYYANEFSAVVVPWSRWSTLPGERTAAWLDDTQEGFRFFLELPPAAWQRRDEAAAGQWAVAAAGLENRLGGFVARAPEFDRERLQATAAALAPLAPLAVVSRTVAAVEACDVCLEEGPCRGPRRLAVTCCDGPRPGARALRAALERLAGNRAADALLWCGGDDPATPQVLAEARVVAALLGC